MRIFIVNQHKISYLHKRMITLFGLIFAGLIFAKLIFAGLIFAIWGKIAKNSPEKMFHNEVIAKMSPANTFI